MHIFCPQCNIGYNVKDTLIPKEGRKLKCSNCGKVFHIDHSGVRPDSQPITTPEKIELQEASAVPVADNQVDDNNTDNSQITSPEISETPETDNTTPSTDTDSTATTITPEEEINIKDIYERLNQQSEHLFQEEQKLPFKDKFLFQLKNLLGLNRKINFKLLGAVLGLFFILVFYNYRYEIVRTVPFSNFFYQIFGIKAKVPGEGLEFQNINWNYVNNEGNRILEIKGFINNPTSRTIEIPTVHVELLDQNTMLLQSLNQKPSVKLLKPEERIAIGMVVKTPSPTAKYVYMTFIDIE